MNFETPANGADTQGAAPVHDPLARLGVRLTGRGLARRRVEAVLAVVADRMSEPIAVEDLASVACMSPFHFSRMFKLATGESPHQMLVRVRIDTARRLLAQTRLPLREIGLLVGYKTQAHFTGAFRRMSGMAPGAYRKRATTAAHTLPSLIRPPASADNTQT
jgi:transcriptional regulator GlxA family with amidase domain